MKRSLPDWPPPTPKEHGAWGILLGSFLSVTAITQMLLVTQLLLVLSISFFYFSRQPFLSIIKSKHRKKDVKWLSSQKGWFLIFAGFGWLFLLATAYYSQYYSIILWSLVLPPFLILEIALIRKRRQKTFFAQLMGVLGLTSIAPLSLLLLQQYVNLIMVYVWLINIVFFTSGILFVRYQIAAMQKKSFQNSELRKYRAAIICYHFCLLIILFLIILYHSKFSGLFIVFLPVLAQAAISVVKRMNFKNLKIVGWLEIAQTATFVVLLALFV